MPPRGLYAVAAHIGIDFAFVARSGLHCAQYSEQQVWERTAGKGKSGSIMMITLGTGIGIGYYVDGRLVPNTELGHIIIRGKDAERRASAGVREKKGYSWEKWGELLTEYLHELERLLWPDLFIIGGGVSDEFDK